MLKPAQPGADVRVWMVVTAAAIRDLADIAAESDGCWPSPIMAWGVPPVDQGQRRGKLRAWLFHDEPLPLGMTARRP
jgi:hypothetical protein